MPTTLSYDQTFGTWVRISRRSDISFKSLGKQIQVNPKKFSPDCWTWVRFCQISHTQISNGSVNKLKLPQNIPHLDFWTWSRFSTVGNPTQISCGLATNEKSPSTSGAGSNVVEDPTHFKWIGKQIKIDLENFPEKSNHTQISNRLENKSKLTKKSPLPTSGQILCDPHPFVCVIS